MDKAKEEDSIEQAKAKEEENREKGIVDEANKTKKKWKTREKKGNQH
jgi:hypothetical protein